MEQLHNIKDIEMIQNHGMTSWDKNELIAHVAAEMKKNPNEPVNVMESTNFVGRFVSTLDLRNFPFDQQDLRIVRCESILIVGTLVSNLKQSHRL